MKLANEAMLGRKTDMILNVPPGFERDIGRTKTGSVQLVFNAEDGALAGVTNSYAQQIIGAYSRELDVSVSHASLSLPVSRCAPAGWYNQELD